MTGRDCRGKPSKVTDPWGGEDCWFATGQGMLLG